MATINQPVSTVSTMLYSSLLSRQSYTTLPEARPSTSASGRRHASPRGVAPVPAFNWATDSDSDDSFDEDDEDDEDNIYRGRSSYCRPVPFALPTNLPARQIKTILPETVRSPHATFAPIAIPPSPLQLATTTVPLFPDRPGESLISIRTLSVESLEGGILGGRRQSTIPPSPTFVDDDAPSVSVLRRSPSTSSNSSTDWDGFSDDDDDENVGPSSPPMFACDEAVLIRRNSDDVDYLNPLPYKRRTSDALPKTPPPLYSFGGLPPSLKPDLSELSYPSSSARSRSLRVAA